MDFNVNAEGAEILGRGNDQPKNEVRKPKMKKFLKIIIYYILIIYLKIL